MEFQATITNEEIDSLPLAQHEGEIIVVDNSDHNDAVEYLKNYTIIGFDTETRPSFKKGVTYPLSLLQLTAGDRTYLFRMDRIKLSIGIIKLLRSRNIIKVGLDIKEDLRKLRNRTPFTPAGFVDLQTLAPQYGIEEKSLKKLTAIVLGQRLSKAQRLSNWAARNLTPQQIKYAATDSLVSRDIYIALLASGNK
ncbi:MAG: 3'-5' exonuclease [Rikenellaceae bacterium]